jgi:hypothetical protein
MGKEMKQTMPKVIIGNETKDWKSNHIGMGDFIHFEGNHGDYACIIVQTDSKYHLVSLESGNRYTDHVLHNNMTINDIESLANVEVLKHISSDKYTLRIETDED